MKTSPASARRFVLAGLIVAVIAAFSFPKADAADLTPEQVAAIRAQLDELKDILEGKASERNRSAWSVFMSASQDAKKAAELHTNCVRIVEFERNGRSDSEFREWQSQQRDRYKDEGYMQSMMLQLRWLAITCKAAEAEKFETVLPDVLSYLDSLSQLEQMPGGAALNSVAGSIFVRAYELERLLGRNESWEAVPYNIEGIYEKIILPYMRSEKPAQLMVAWDKRIDHQTRLAAFIKAQHDSEMRGDRDEKRRIQERQRRETSRGVLSGYSEEDFLTDTLPKLHWARLGDKYRFVDKASASHEILTFLNEHITHKNAIDWLTEFQAMLGDAQSPGFEEPDSSEPLPGEVVNTPDPSASSGSTSERGSLLHDSLLTVVTRSAASE